MIFCNAPTEISYLCSRIIAQMKVNNRIHLCLAHMSPDGMEQKYIQEAFDTNWVAPLGPNVDAFERELESCLGEKHVAALSSCTAAIHLALLLLGVGKEDEVLCQSLSFCASSHPVTYCGARPVFVDSESATWNIDPNLLEEAIKDRIAKTGKKPKAIIVVDLYGMPAQWDAIEDIAHRYEIPIIEDAANALGSYYNGKPCSTFGAIRTLSFNGNKIITTSGGGALVCDDIETKKKAIFLATQAKEPYLHYEHNTIGYNYRMSNICAGIGRGQMTVLESHVNHHKHVHGLYTELFKNIDGILCHGNPNGDYDSNFWLTTITFKKAVDVEAICKDLDQAGIEARPLWKPMHKQPVYKDAPAYINGVSENLFQTGMCLPSGPYVSDEDVRYSVEKLKEALV